MATGAGRPLRQALMMALGLGLLVACSRPIAADPQPAPAATTPVSRQSPSATPASPPLLGAAGAGARPDSCLPPEPDMLQNVLGTPAGPYLIHHPGAEDPRAPVLIFLSGGSGSQTSARRAWANYLSGGPGVDSYRVVLPYGVDVDFIDEAQRTFKVLDEVIACYGDAASKVHLAGVSNGGLAAYGLMLQHPERFTTLLGAPGAFPLRTEPVLWAKALGSRAVFNGVGANDDGWRSDVKATHEALVAAGVDSVYVEFPGQGHTAREGFDKSVLFDFWRRHS